MSKYAPKRGDYRSFEEYIKSKTGKTIFELNSFTKQTIQRLEDVACMIRKCIEKKMPVYIVGDYDADGITSIIILSRLMKYLNADVHLIIPERADGYGLSMKYIEKIPDGCLLITVDNGITAVEPIAEAKRRGMMVIILDHHLSGEKIPDADIIIDPEAFPDTADFNGYCGAGISYKLCELMIKDEDLLDEVSAYAATGTVADIVPLREDNRRIVQKGLKVINSGKIPYGFQMLYRLLCGEKEITSEQIAFYAAPAINAPGRLISRGGQLSAKSISCASKSDAELLVAKMIRVNNERKDLVNAAMDEITKTIDEDYLKKHKVMFLHCDAPHGILGLIAAKVAEKYERPAFQMAEKNGLYTGSFRSDDEKKNNGYDMMTFAKDCFVSFGGHAGAAGFALKIEDFEKTSAKLEEYDVVPHEEYMYDLELVTERLKDVLEQMDKAEPFGKDIEKPVFRIECHITPDDIIPLKNDQHVKFRLPNNIEAIFFNIGEQYKKDGCPLDFYLYGAPAWNYYRGSKTPQFAVERYEPITD